MPPRRKGAPPVASARRDASPYAQHVRRPPPAAERAAADRTAAAQVAANMQICRNSYMMAVSQLLQLVKQMEYDASLSDWEAEVDERV